MKTVYMSTESLQYGEYKNILIQIFNSYVVTM